MQKNITKKYYKKIIALSIVAIFGLGFFVFSKDVKAQTLGCQSNLTSTTPGFANNPSGKFELLADIYDLSLRDLSSTANYGICVYGVNGGLAKSYNFSAPVVSGVTLVSESQLTADLQPGIYAWCGYAYRGERATPCHFSTDRQQVFFEVSGVGEDDFLTDVKEILQVIELSEGDIKLDNEISEMILAVDKLMTVDRYDVQEKPGVVGYVQKAVVAARTVVNNAALKLKQLGKKIFPKRFQQQQLDDKVLLEDMQKIISTIEDQGNANADALLKFDKFFGGRNELIAGIIMALNNNDYGFIATAGATVQAKAAGGDGDNVPLWWSWGRDNFEVVEFPGVRQFVTPDDPTIRYAEGVASLFQKLDDVKKDPKVSKANKLLVDNSYKTFLAHTFNTSATGASLHYELQNTLWGANLVLRDLLTLAANSSQDTRGHLKTYYNFLSFWNKNDIATNAFVANGLSAELITTLNTHYKLISAIHKKFSTNTDIDHLAINIFTLIKQWLE